MSPCGSTCTSRAAPVASRAVTERSRPPVTRRRTCRAPEGPEATSRSSSPDAADHSMHADDAARVRLNGSDYRLARSQVDLLVARQVPASRSSAFGHNGQKTGNNGRLTPTVRSRRIGP